MHGVGHKMCNLCLTPSGTLFEFFFFFIGSKILGLVFFLSDCSQTWGFEWYKGASQV